MDVYGHLFKSDDHKKRWMQSRPTCSRIRRRALQFDGAIFRTFLRGELRFQDAVNFDG